MTDPLSLLSEAERMNIEMKSVQVEIQKASGEIAELEVQMNELISKKEGIEASLAESEAAYEEFLRNLPETLNADKVRKIVEERIDQLAEMGLLEGMAQKPKAKTRGRKPGSKNTKSKKTPSEQPAAGKGEDTEKTVQDPIEEIANKDAPSSDAGETSQDDEIVSNLLESRDQDDSGDAGGESGIEVPGFLKA